MVGVRTWTDDETWFVLKASEITKPNTSSTHLNPRPIRYFTDEEIATLCKKNAPNRRHIPDASGVRYIRSHKKAHAPRPSQAVLAAIARLRHECNTSAQHQDGMSENMFSTPQNISRGKLTQVQGFGGFANTAPALGHSRLEDLDSLALGYMNNRNGNRAGQIVPEQFQTMNAMNPPSLAGSHQMMAIRFPSNTFGNEQINHDLFDASCNMGPQGFNRPYQQYGINGDIAFPDSSSQQQYGQARHETTLPTNFPISSCARAHGQLDQTMNYVQQMGALMQNGNGIPRIPQQMYPSGMAQLQGNQMGSGISTFEPQMQAYNYGNPTQSPYPPNYRGYTSGPRDLQNLGRNEMMIPPGPADVGRFTNPHGIPSDGQINGGIMSHGGQYNGKDQHLAQQQAGVQFYSLSSGVDLDALPDPQLKPPKSHGLPKTTVTSPDVTTSHGLQQATMNTPGSTNYPAKHLSNPEMSNNFGNQDDAAAEAIRPQSQPSAGNEKGHKRKVDKAGFYDLNLYKDSGRKNKRNNGEGSSGSRLSNHNDHYEVSDQISITHTLARIQGLHKAAQAAELPDFPAFPAFTVGPFDSLNAAPVPAMHSPAQLDMDSGRLDMEFSVFSPELPDQVQGQFQQQLEASTTFTNSSSDLSDPPTPQFGETSNAASASKFKEAPLV
ncbi:predicted protein [Sclerotinia sclerotiorum 1980 UF-70]|uniref:Uncharacterized protein n=2 Tax=Sclerotinia sclerotiorum (strain ATCC 18683 / 1980 / Ss-1) TaxID=665079 RepID=A7EKL3_SCLS1|nr:predicted protein [Sclerotinia sclerotiorum 1980 UF-70]APA09895.1 hypothetical protein sscle_05g046650 [Sclerotinia sclerotiorum 1980 UF-70]EDO03379.1 predicted protein [Sclerotinia sclerotiorum 1980 UF-70]